MKWRSSVLFFCMSTYYMDPSIEIYSIELTFLDISSDQPLETARSSHFHHIQKTATRVHILNSKWGGNDWSHQGHPSTSEGSTTALGEMNCLILCSLWTSPHLNVCRGVIFTWAIFGGYLGSLSSNQWKHIHLRPALLEHRVAGRVNQPQDYYTLHLL